MRLLSPVIAFCLLAATALSGCIAAKKQAEKPPEPCTVQDYSPAEIFKQASPSIVVIKAGDSQGSGFVVKQDKRYTYILTNSHVVAGANEVSIKWADDREEKAKVISDHGGEPLQKDLALLQVDAIRGKPLALKEKPPAIGADVVVIGAPQGLEFSLSRGVLSQLRDSGDFLQVDAAVNPGNSGGPLFDKTGCVVGVVTFKAQESEGLNFAISYGPTKHFLENPSIDRKAKKAAPKPKVAESKFPLKRWITVGLYGGNGYLQIYAIKSQPEENYIELIRRYNGVQGQHFVEPYKGAEIGNRRFGRPQRYYCNKNKHVGMRNQDYSYISEYQLASDGWWYDYSPDFPDQKPTRSQESRPSDDDFDKQMKVMTNDLLTRQFRAICKVIS